MNSFGNSSATKEATEAFFARLLVATAEFDFFLRSEVILVVERRPIVEVESHPRVSLSSIVQYISIKCILISGYRISYSACCSEQTQLS